MSNSEAFSTHNCIIIDNMITKERITDITSDASNYNYICIPQAA